MYLQGPHLQLRALEPEDLDMMYTIENDTSLWDVSNRQVPYSREVLRQYIINSQADLYADKQVRLMMELRTTHETVGAIDLFNFEPLHRHAEVGIAVLQAHQGKGYATEALQLLCDYAFRFLGMEQLVAHIASDNTCSMQLFSTCGFTPCGTLKRWWNVEGTFKDVTLMQQLKNNH
ncbi:MAG: GNAT family N-acetyltransferase [Mediterranea sp.]|nr:GNAT family N-acetyltransferase [Mediterranea sp.]